MIIMRYAYSLRYCFGSESLVTVQKWLSENMKSSPVKVQHHFLLLRFCHYRIHFLFPYLYVSPLAHLPASLLDRKPRSFGSYMKYESESHWMRIVRPLEPKPATMGSDLGSIVL